MTNSDIKVYAQCVAVLDLVNEKLGTTFKLVQLRGKDFERMRLENRNGTVLCGTLAELDKVIAGILAVMKEIER